MELPLKAIVSQFCFFFFFNLSAFCSFLKARDIMCRVLPIIAGVVPKCTSRLKENTAVFMNK